MNPPKVEFLRTISKFRKSWEEISSSLVHFLCKTWNSAFSTHIHAVTAKKCTNKHDARAAGVPPPPPLGYYEWGPRLLWSKIEEKYNQKKPIAVWFPAYLLYLPSTLKSLWQPCSQSTDCDLGTCCGPLTMFMCEIHLVCCSNLQSYSRNQWKLDFYSQKHSTL